MRAPRGRGHERGHEMAIEIREHAPGRRVEDFLRVAHEVYRGDPAWVPPLELELRDRLNPAKNPFFQHASGVLFTAWRDGRPVGRISAQIDREHLRIYDDDVGFFGFFDTVDDEEVARTLAGRAERWLRERGMKRMRGPLSLSINEETGLLVDGFAHPPFPMMGHSRPYQAGLAEAAGLHKIKDLYAWRYQSGHIPRRAERAWEHAHSLPEVRIRSVDKSDMARELDTIMGIYNDAWSANWGFVPLTEAEVEKVGKDLKLIIDEDLAFIAEVNGRPAAMCICIPNVNAAIYDLGGKLSPAGVMKLVWRLKVRPPDSARVMLLGLRSDFRGTKRYGGLATAMYVEIAKRGPKKGYYWGELSWTLEDNRAINMGIRAMGGEVYKTYRLFEKAIAGAP